MGTGWRRQAGKIRHNLGLGLPAHLHLPQRQAVPVGGMVRRIVPN